MHGWQNLQLLTDAGRKSAGSSAMDYDDLLTRLATEHAAEVDAERLQLTLWALVRGTQRAVARTRRHPSGIELLVMVDGDLQLAQAFTATQLHDLERLEAETRAALQADGWRDAGP